MAFQLKPTLRSKFVFVMNINIVPFIILDVSKVFSWCHNHLIIWSYMIASIIIYIKSTFHVTMYKNKMKFHMLMFMNAWMMLVLIKCKCQMQCLTLGCYIFNRWRICVSQCHISYLFKEYFGMIFMLAIYILRCYAHVYIYL